MAKILVADDNSNIQKMVVLALKDQGIEVVAVGNGEAAVRKISDIKPDLVLANFSSNTVSVLLGNGNATFQAQKTFSTGTGPLSVALSDVNGDGKPDIAVANKKGVFLFVQEPAKSSAAAK